MLPVSGIHPSYACEQTPKSIVYPKPAGLSL